MEEAKFSLERYFFEEISLNLVGLASNSHFSLRFSPFGEFHKKENLFKLRFGFKAIDDGTQKEIVSVVCKANFRFQSEIELDDIPDYFYPNSIAILFPYVRALVSTLTLQANIKPILLPTLNLSSLKDRLKENTKAI